VPPIRDSSNASGLGFIPMAAGSVLRTSNDAMPRRFTIEALLGYGGMGAIYRARAQHGDVVALKILHDRFRASPSMAARFARESRLANRVDHPKAVRIVDAGVSDDGSPFIVTELLEGDTFEARMRAAGGKLPLAEVICCADELLDVLATAHSRGVVHRDIKPANLFRLPSGELRVLDFGLAQGDLDQTTGETQLTSANAVLGTAGFMAPELALGRWDLVDAQSDLWAVAATCLYLATGKHVHDASTVQERLALAATRPAPPVVTRAPELPRALAAWLDRGLAFSKRERFENAQQMREALAAMTLGRSAPSRRSGTRIAALMAITAISAAAVASSFGRRGEPKPPPTPPAIAESVAAVAFSARLEASAQPMQVPATVSVRPAPPIRTTARPPGSTKTETAPVPATVPSADVSPVAPLDRRR
jgi:serine/threonine-protein kinase